LPLAKSVLRKKGYPKNRASLLTASSTFSGFPTPGSAMATKSFHSKGRILFAASARQYFEPWTTNKSSWSGLQVSPYSEFFKQTALLHAHHSLTGLNRNSNRLGEHERTGIFPCPLSSSRKSTVVILHLPPASRATLGRRVGSALPAALFAKHYVPTALRVDPAAAGYKV